MIPNESIFKQVEVRTQTQTDTFIAFCVVESTMESVLSRFQKQRIVKQMIQETHHLTLEGMSPAHVKASVDHLRDLLVQQALTDLHLRQQRGHLR